MNLVVYSFLFSIFYCVGGSPRPVSYTAKRFSDQPIFLISFVRGMCFLGWIVELSFLFSVFSWVGGSPRSVSYTAKRCGHLGLFLILLNAFSD